MGMASDVRFAAWMPAKRATAVTGPFSRLCAFTRAMAFFEMVMRPEARASRTVSALSVTSTIRAREFLPTCESLRTVFGADFRARALGMTRPRERTRGDGEPRARRARRWFDRVREGRGRSRGHERRC